MKRLVICCDGTWQRLYGDSLTNVALTARSIASRDAKGNLQIVYYSAGVGASLSGLSLWQGMTEEANLRVGYGIIQWTMDVERSSDGATARMAQRDNEAIFVSYGSKPSFFQESSFGYTFMVNYTYFDMKNQMVSGTEFINYGTEVKGHLVYAVPTLFYQWGEHRYQGRFVRLGFGAGLGAAQFDGTVRLSTGEVVYAEKKTFEPRLALSNFLEARWNQFGISISYASPRVYGDGYDIRVSNLTANIGYVYYF